MPDGETMSVKITQAPFTIEILAGGKPKITRDIVYTNGDKISFAVTLEEDRTATIPDLHRKSVEELISRLEEFIGRK